MATLRIKLVGADPRAEVEGRGELEGEVNDFRGNDPGAWRMAVCRPDSGFLGAVAARQSCLELECFSLQPNPQASMH